MADPFSDELSLPGPMNDLVSEQERVTAVTLTPLGVAVLAQQKT
jgi:hypothetical protein